MVSFHSGCTNFFPFHFEFLFPPIVNKRIVFPVGTGLINKIRFFIFFQQLTEDKLSGKGKHNVNFFQGGWGVFLPTEAKGESFFSQIRSLG